MIRKLRTERDNQQWMLDLALNMRGRVQNFERDDIEVPAGKRARNYRMLPKVWREAGEKHEKFAKRAHASGGSLRSTAIELGYVTTEQFDRVVRPGDMTGPTR